MKIARWEITRLHVFVAQAVIVVATILLVFAHKSNWNYITAACLCFYIGVEGFYMWKRHKKT
jgi:hypothetical protein